MRPPLPIATLLLTAFLLPQLAPAASADDGAPIRKVTIVNVEYEGTKIWLPGTIAVTKGTKVELTLINDAPSGQHGFAIHDFGVAVVVEKGTPAQASFIADREGVFPIICHLHPAHVGGQVIVLP
jgi:nitrosocyanin